MNYKAILRRFIRCYSKSKIYPQMRAWQIYRYGDIEQLRFSNSYQTPLITSSNQVLVKVRSTSINPIDVHLTSGYGASAFNIVRKLKDINEFPITLGRDFSGTVVKVGSSVKSFLPEMDVIGALWPYQNGCHADYVICCQSQLAPKPTKLTHNEAASIPYAGLTAYSALCEFGGLKAGNGSMKRVLILGSGGGVGTIGVQIAKYYGAHVSVTCREHSLEILKKIGADNVFNDKDDLTNEPPFDIILDCIGSNEGRYRTLIKSCPSSRFVTIKHPLLQMTDKYSPLIGVPMASLCFTKSLLVNAVNTKGAIYQWGFFRSSGANLSVLSNMADQGKLVPIVQEVYDFDNIPEAYKAFEVGSINGKVVITVDSDARDQ